MSPAHATPRVDDVFEETRARFVRMSGGVFVHRRPWHRMTSQDKRALFWDYFRGAEAAQTTGLYAPTTVLDLVRNRRHSVEHIVPRSALRRWLAHAPGRVRNGATANPLNLAAEDARLNRARGDVRYDLDGDEVVNVMATVTARGPPDTVGPDAEGEWVPPSRSHGDIARAVLYMTLVYRLPLPLDARWLGWIADDPPSAQERAFNIWTRRRWRIGNPLVEHPAMVGELAFALRWT